MKSYEEIIKECGALVASFLVEDKLDQATTVSAAMTYVLARVFEEKDGVQMQQDIAKAAAAYMIVSKMQEAKDGGVAH